MKISRRKNRGLIAAVLAELCKEYRANRNVHADAERIRAADDFQKSLLRKLFHKDAVLGQKSCVMQADADFQKAFEFRTVRARKTEMRNFLGNRRLFFLGAKI